MKITAGIGMLEEYESYVKAGADEVFCGYVPFFWNEKYGNVLPLNRREVLFYHVQLGCLTDMKILYEMMESNKVPVAITFNALYYTREQIGDILLLLGQLITIGYKDFIIADVNLIRAIYRQELPCRIHVSGEIGEWNHYSLKWLLTEFSNATTRITRIIFHRKTGLDNMERMISFGKRLDPELEFEAFCMNENCHYTGGFCNSLHCDEMVHMCQLEYRLVGGDNKEESMEYDVETKAQELIYSTIGTNGCGLCSISKLRDIGVTHLKIVGRGLPAQEMEKDIKAVKAAMGYEKSSDYIKMIGLEACSRQCYYESFY